MSRKIVFRLTAYEEIEGMEVHYDQDPYYLSEELWESLSSAQIEQLFEHKLTETKGFFRELVKREVGVDIFPIGVKVFI